MKNRWVRQLFTGFVLAAVLMGRCQKTTEKENTTEISDETDQEAAKETADAVVQTDDTDPAVRDVFAMDTYMTLTAYGDGKEEAVDAAEAEITRLDTMLSTGNPDSEIAKVNAAGNGLLSEDAAYLVERSLELYESTGGKFDIAIYPVMKAWGFADQNFRVPDAEELQTLLENTDASKISLNEATDELQLPEGMEIDLGGIAKGYTSSRIMEIYKSLGITSGLVNLGGNVQALGSKPDGSLWRVAVQSSNSEEDYLGVLSISDRAVITSGGYERYFEQDGITYHHIIDPSTGYPANNGLTSVTIVSEDGTLADGLSTSMFILGREQAADYWQQHKDEFDMILLDDNNALWVTEGIADSFEPLGDRTAEVIHVD